MATLRQARGTTYPDPLFAALIAEQAGADSITIHLREDRRHIQDRDVRMCKDALQTRLNLEMAATDEMVRIALEIRPPDVCLVPEKRTEVTTEGGLDVLGQAGFFEEVCAQLAQAGIRVSLFIDPEPRSWTPRCASARLWSSCTPAATPKRWASIEPKSSGASKLPLATRPSLGLTVHAGHGLHYHNVQPVAAIHEIVELNIGHAIVAHAVIHGMASAVSEMKRLMLQARAGR